MTVNAHKVRIYTDANGEYRWTASDSNGETVADSGEGYKRLTYTADAVRSLFPDAEVVIESE